MVCLKDCVALFECAWHRFSNPNPETWPVIGYPICSISTAEPSPLSWEQNLPFVPTSLSTFSFYRKRNKNQFLFKQNRAYDEALKAFYDQLKEYMDKLQAGGAPRPPANLEAPAEVKAALARLVRNEQ
jgi:hypothetical protein